MSQPQIIEYDEHEIEYEVKYLSANDLKVAASILYNAYFQDPLFVDIFKADEEGYDLRLRSAIREELNVFWDAKQPMLGVYRNASLVAVTCLLAPNPEFGHGRYWHWRLRMLLTAGFLGTQHLLEKEKKVRSNLPTQNCHMISFIGVHPQHQDQGIGHILLAGINEIVNQHPDSKGVAVYVTLEKCLSFFDDGGFKHVKTLQTSNISGRILYKPQ
jgi:ribosomal protein S18 acetylase RimI-like enzyme